MRTIIKKPFARISLILELSVAGWLAAQPADAQVPASLNHQTTKLECIPFNQLGAVAAKQYQGDGLSVIATADGARLRCVFQHLEGLATPEGLWLRSTAENAAGERFSVVATATGREPDHRFNLARTGTVTVAEQTVRFVRPGLTEEYTVSMDGVRQDFIVSERPKGTGKLLVELDVVGAKAEPLVNGVQLVLDGPGRKLAYSRLHVTDVEGRELAARMEVVSTERLALRVEDENATYPLRIDPTFSDANWVSLNPSMPGADYRVFAIAVDGAGNVYIGGGFIVVGGVIANCIAKWDGSAWSALGSGMGGTPSPSVTALAVSGTNLYAAGSFATAGGSAAYGIARWNGTAWSALGSGMNSGVSALAVSGTDLYAGGDFTYATNTGPSVVKVNHIAKWDGSTWSALGSGMGDQYDRVYAMAVSGTDLYAGGSFRVAGGASANSIAKWDGSTWSALGSGMNLYGSVRALAVSGTDLYAGGSFSTMGGVPVNSIAKWDGSAWSALGSGTSGGVNALAVSGTDLYVGGSFSTAGGVPVIGIAKWDGSAWSALSSELGPQIFALAVSGSNLYAGGGFQMTQDGVPVNFIAKWDGSAWSALGSGMNGEVRALAVSGTYLYAGGDFITAGGVTANYIAKWDGNAWSALGSGMSGSSPYYGRVRALAVGGTNLYAGGYFTSAGGVPANYIAQWDGNTWSALGSGVTGQFQYDTPGVFALAVSGTSLYAGGYFTNAGGVSANFIAKWDGSAWSALGSGVYGTYYGSSGPPGVAALAVGGPFLYAGGAFTEAGGVTVNFIAKWNGSAWSALGEGMSQFYVPYSASPSVSALAVSGIEVYAGGYFDTAGGVLATNIAKWNGSTWSAMGSGINSSVRAMAVSGTNLYAGGGFGTAGEVSASRIAKWDGSAWSALGSGTSSGYYNEVAALAADVAEHLFVGGYFSVAGNTVSPYIAQANISLLGGQLTSPAFSNGTGYRFTFKDGSVGQPYRIQTSSSMAAGTWMDLTNFTYTGPVVITDTSIVSAPKCFYRAVTP